MKPFDVYPLFDVEITKGRGCRTYDKQGNEYLDLYGGHAVISIGHSHPLYIQRLTQQLNELGFYSNSVHNNLQVTLAEKLGIASGYEDYSLFLINSGAEANENALKLASFYNGRKRIIAFGKSFHGRTSAAVRVTDNPKIIAPVNAGLEVTFLPMNDFEALSKELNKGDVSSVIIEGIQGVGGVRLPDERFLKYLAEECKRTRTVLILDEIQSGYGRSGKFFAHQYAGIRPDLITVAKGMGNGFPIGGVLIAPFFEAVHGQLGTTFGGNHLACTAAIAVLDVFAQERLIENAQKTGAFLLKELDAFPKIKEVRGLGLMIGIEMEKPVADLRRRLLFEQKVFTGGSGTHVIRLLPPLCLTHDDALLFLERFEMALRNE
ncbi:aspartate aminotransferase family protein [Microbacter margulisiae]|uniref:Acetylornithine aminotransferase n=1 Tax=Microbacter margulisiae TaxID=1350067 RepID=A0A7W5H201_9PORP|nr:aminotransferase class III-fold pyridoxal phosphate-dependent enzyme [Microbacter margulisiae]MBB3186921.1 acetylornithine aminotransferase [Microbacter margulisiae]